MAVVDNIITEQQKQGKAMAVVDNIITGLSEFVVCFCEWGIGLAVLLYDEYIYRYVCVGQTLSI